MQLLHRIVLLAGTMVLLFSACKPDRDDEIQLLPAPDAPEFSIEMVQGDSNRVVVTDKSGDNFQRLWDVPGSIPASSVRVSDTLFFPKAGTYSISLFVSKSNGSGTASSRKTIQILTDAPITCSPKYALLTGDCGPQGKCWTMAREAGALKVGPTYDDYSWFTSVVNGLQNEQYDDDFCFTFDGFVFKNDNKGVSVDPWDGYKAIAYNAGVSTFSFVEGAGISGRDRIILPDDQFMGVWDCDNVLDVIKLTETELIVRGKQREKNGAPKPEGWFELKFVAR